MELDVRASPVWSELTTMLDRIAETIVELLGFGVAAVNVARSDGSLEVVSVAGDPAARAALLGTVSSAAEFDGLLTISEPWGRLRFLDHRSMEPDFLTWVPDLPVPEDEEAWHPEDALFAPLHAADGRRLGILSVDLPLDGRRPEGVRRRALEAFAVSTALAIENAILRAHAQESENQLRERASQDWLTGVGNRSLGFERLEQALEQDRRSVPVTGDPGLGLLAVVFLDLNGFKAINDRHSHVAGDQVLRAVGTRLRALVRPEDTVVRWGGDEFLVLLDRVADEDTALRVAARIAEEVSHPIPHSGQLLRVTASVGLAFGAPGEAAAPDELVRRADTAMYLAKADGGGRCAVYRHGTAALATAS